MSAILLTILGTIGVILLFLRRPALSALMGICVVLGLLGYFLYTDML